MLLFVLIITTVVFVFSKALGYGLGFAGIALVLAGIMSIGSYYYSDKIVLATTGAKEIKKSDNPELFRTVENLCIGDGLPMPKIYIIDDPSLTLLQQEEILARYCLRHFRHIGNFG